MNSLSLPLRKWRSFYIRDLLWELVLRNIKLRYKGSVLGIVWSLIYSVAQMRVFAFLFRPGLGRDIGNYPAYIFIGVIAWGWFQSSLNLTSDAITGNRELMRRPGFPAAILPAVTIATTLIDFVVAFPVLLIFLVAGGSELTPALLALPLVMILHYLLMLGIGYMLATFQVTFRDTRHLLLVILRMGLFLSPIFYDPVNRVPPRYLWIYRLNPLVHLLDAYRAILLDGKLPQPTSLLVLMGLIIVLLPLGYKIFSHAKYRFLEEL